MAECHGPETAAGKDDRSTGVVPFIQNGDQCQRRFADEFPLWIMRHFKHDAAVTARLEALCAGRGLPWIGRGGEKSGLAYAGEGAASSPSRPASLNRTPA